MMVSQSAIVGTTHVPVSQVSFTDACQLGRIHRRILCLHVLDVAVEVIDGFLMHR
jgi:hypothetical protein